MAGDGSKGLMMGLIRNYIYKGVAGEYLKGTGIEIGPGSNPFPIPRRCEIKYVDRNSGDITDDAETLSKFPDNSQDFVIMSHVLEHLPNPMRAIENIHRVLKPGGVTFIVVPNKNLNKEDINQGLTSIERFEQAYNGIDRKPECWGERAWCVRRASGEANAELRRLYDKQDKRIHFNHFVSWSFLMFLERACEVTGANFKMLGYTLNDRWYEFIVVMSKDGQLMPSIEHINKHPQTNAITGPLIILLRLRALLRGEK